MAKKYRMLDLFCGAGGAAYGYWLAFKEAGLDIEITGVDIKPQQNYPFRMMVGDAMTWPLHGYDFIHGSPPCQDHSVSSNRAKKQGKIYDTGWMLQGMFDRFRNLSIPWIIENVATAKMPNSIILCGSVFGLRVIRHRKFISNQMIYSAGPCRHAKGATLTGEYLTVTTHCGHHRNQPKHTVQQCKDAMGIDWMTGNEVGLAIPPAYTRWLGHQIAHILSQNVGAA